MLKKRWYIVPLMAGLLALAATGGAIFAQGNSGGHGGIQNQGIVTRVAEILGLEETTVQDAFSQAYRERRAANLQARLDRLVANEKLTRDEADAIGQWYQARPVADLPLRRFLHHSEARVQQVLDRMVEAERLTQAQSDAAMEWYQEMPEALSELISGRHPFDRGSRGRGFHPGLKQRDKGSATDARFDGASRRTSPQVTARGVSY